MDWRCVPPPPPPTLDNEDDATAEAAAGCTKVCSESEAAEAVSKAVISDTGCACSAPASASAENDDGNDEAEADEVSNGGGNGLVVGFAMDDCDGRKERKDDRAEPGLEAPDWFADDGAGTRVRREESVDSKEALLLLLWRTVPLKADIVDGSS